MTPLITPFESGFHRAPPGRADHALQWWCGALAEHDDSGTAIRFSVGGPEARRGGGFHLNEVASDAAALFVRSLSAQAAWSGPAASGASTTRAGAPLITVIAQNPAAPLSQNQKLRSHNPEPLLSLVGHFASVCRYASHFWSTSLADIARVTRMPGILLPEPKIFGVRAQPG